MHQAMGDARFAMKLEPFVPVRRFVDTTEGKGGFVHPDQLPSAYEEWKAEQRASHPGAGLVPWQLTADEIEAIDWQWRSCDPSPEHYVVPAAREACEWGDVQGACEVLGASKDAAISAAGGGLVSVLSTQNRATQGAPRTMRKREAVKPFRVQVAQAAAVQAAGAFVAGGANARMAKLRRAVGFAARAQRVPRKGHRNDEVLMITATYAEADAWQPNHVRELMDHVRKWHNRKGLDCRYVWVAELQDGKRIKGHGVGRMVVHYHIALWVPFGTRLPMPDNQGWWKHGTTRIEVAKGAVQYLMHYLKKGNSKHFGSFPDGCRIYGVGGLDHAMRRARRWLGLPSFVQANSSIGCDWKRAPVGTGGGWIDPDGHAWPSEFRRINCGGAWCLQRVYTHARQIEAAGPFSWIVQPGSAA